MTAKRISATAGGGGILRPVPLPSIQIREAGAGSGGPMAAVHHVTLDRSLTALFTFAACGRARKGTPKEKKVISVAIVKWSRERYHRTDNREN